MHTTDGIVHVKLQDGSERLGRKVVVATGGMYLDHNLAGILTPCYSYLFAEYSLQNGTTDDCFHQSGHRAHCTSPIRRDERHVRRDAWW